MFFCGSNFFLQVCETNIRTRGPSLPFGLWGHCRNFEIAIFDKCNVRLKYGFRKLFYCSVNDDAFAPQPALPSSIMRSAKSLEMDDVSLVHLMLFL